MTALKQVRLKPKHAGIKKDNVKRTIQYGTTIDVIHPTATLKHGFCFHYIKYTGVINPVAGTQYTNCKRSR